MAQPIYYVIAEQKSIPFGISCYQIVKVIACDYDDTDETNRIYREEVIPLYSSGRQIVTMYFHREPDNPFREVVHL